MDAAGGALCPIPPRLTDDSREEAAGAKDPKSAMKGHESRSDHYEDTHEKQLAAQQRAEAAWECLLAALQQEEH